MGDPDTVGQEGVSIDEAALRPAERDSSLAIGGMPPARSCFVILMHRPPLRPLSLVRNAELSSYIPRSIVVLPAKRLNVTFNQK